MIYLGSKVKIKSVEQIIEEGVTAINPRNGLPFYACDSMRPLYGNDVEYEVVKYISHKYDFEDEIVSTVHLRVPIANCRNNIYEFDVHDLIKISDPDITNPYKVGDKVVISLSNAYHGGEAGVITYIEARTGYDTIYEIDGDYNIREEFIDGLCGDDYVPPVRFNCMRCHSRYTVEPNEFVCEEDAYLCPVCRKRKFITPYHRYRPHLEFFGENSNADDLFYGVELEVDCGGETDSTAADVMDILNDDKLFVYCSHDGSLNNGFEIITQPATLIYHKEFIDKYKRAFKHLVALGYRSHDTSTAGIHVHFSRDFYKENEEDNIAKLLYLVEKFWDDIVVFSRRDYRTLERYAKKMDTSSVLKALDFVDSWNKTDDHDGHYYAVNISNPNTIELRFFRGTLNTLTFEAILEFTDSLVRTAKDKSVSELQALTFDDLLTPLCKKYYESRLSSLEFDETKNK